jgi:hypothetical protein
MYLWKDAKRLAAFAETLRAGRRYAHSGLQSVKEVVDHDYCPSP